MGAFDDLISDLEFIEKEETRRDEREKDLELRRFWSALDAELDAETSEWRMKK